MRRGTCTCSIACAVVCRAACTIQVLTIDISQPVDDTVLKRTHNPEGLFGVF